jgi:hypothetical protein
MLEIAKDLPQASVIVVPIVAAELFRELRLPQKTSCQMSVLSACKQRIALR